MRRPSTGADTPEPAPRSLPSFESVYRDNVRFVWRSVRRLGVAEADVEDVCQRVFEVVHRQLPGFRGQAKVTTWLFGIVMRVVADHRKSAYQRRRSDRDDRALEQAVAPPQEGHVARAEARALLDRLLGTLDEDKRVAFVLVELEGMAVKEVAEVLGCPVQTVYSRVRVARERMEQAARRMGITGSAA